MRCMLWNYKKITEHKALNRISNLLDLKKNHVCFLQCLSRFDCVAPKGSDQAIGYTSYVPYTCRILSPLFSCPIDEVWLPGLCCAARKGEHTSHGCCLGSSHHFGVSQVHAGATGRWPRVIMNWEDAANSQPLRVHVFAFPQLKGQPKRPFTACGCCLALA